MFLTYMQDQFLRNGIKYEGPGKVIPNTLQAMGMLTEKGERTEKACAYFAALEESPDLYFVPRLRPSHRVLLDALPQQGNACVFGALAIPYEIKSRPSTTIMLLETLIKHGLADALGAERFTRFFYRTEMGNAYCRFSDIYFVPFSVRPTILRKTESEYRKRQEQKA